MMMDIEAIFSPLKTLGRWPDQHLPQHPEQDEMVRGLILVTMMFCQIGQQDQKFDPFPYSV